MLLKITLHNAITTRVTWSTYWEDALAAVRGFLNESQFGGAARQSIAEDRGVIKGLEKLFNDKMAYSAWNTKEVCGNQFKIEEVKITPANEVILNELFRCRRSGGIDGGWVRYNNLRTLVSSNGALMGTMNGLIKLGIAEKQSQTLLDGEVMKFCRIRREHVYGR
jgi:hypothetical protein